MTKIIVKDDFLDKDTFDYIYSKSLQGDNNAQKLDTVKRYIFSEDPTPQISEFINYFEKKRGYRKLSKIIHTSEIPPHYKSQVHDEAEFKIMSAVVYLGPEKSNGTKFYMDEEFEIEWKPNRLMVFCGETGVTWHDYSSGVEPRFTYNYFLVDSSKVYNEAVKNNLLRM